MKDKAYTKKELIAELERLRKRVEELEKSETSLKSLEGTLRAKLDVLEKIFVHVSAGIFIIDEQGRYVYINPACGDMIGLDSKNWSGKAAGLSIHSDDRQKAQKHFLEVIGGEYRSEIIRVHAAGGRLRTLLLEGTPITIHGRPHGLCIMHDITDRIEDENALRESEERYCNLVDTSFDGVLMHSGGKIIEVNRRFAKMFGYEPSEMVGMRGRDILSKESFDRLNRFVRDGYDRPVEIIGIRKDGSEIHLDVIGRPSLLNGREVRIGAVRDITDRKLAEKALLESEQRYRATINAISDWIHVVDPDLRVILYNSALKKWVEEFGCTDDLIGKTIHEIFPFLSDEVMEEYREVFRTGDAMTTEEINFIDGVEIVTETQKIPIIQGDVVSRVVTIIRDITSRKQDERALMESEERYRGLFNSTFEGIVVHDKGVALDTNIAMSNILGYMPHEIIGKSVLDFLTEKSRRTIKEKLSSDSDENYELDMMARDGSVVNMEIMSKPLVYKNRRVRLVAMRDITDRKRAEEALREAEARYRALYDRSLYCVYVHDKMGNFIDANDATLDLFGYTRDEIHSLNIVDIMVDKNKLGDAVEAIDEIIKNGYQSNFNEWKLRKKSGEIVWVETEASAIYRKGEFYAIQGIARDITERKLAERSLADEKERLAVTLRSIGDGVITTDIEGRVALINKVAESITGWTQEEAQGRLLSEIFEMIDEKTGVALPDPVKRVIDTGGTVDLVEGAVLIDRNGVHKNIADSGAPIRDRDSEIVGVVIVFRDITKTRHMEEELFKARKLESLGILAGGIAHDFNNILTGIMGNISLSRNLSRDSGRVLKILSEAENACVRAQNLTMQLLTFSKGGAPVKQVSSLGNLLRTTVDFSVSGSKTKCEYRIPDNLSAVNIDEGQISQVVNNLVINAMQSMPSGGNLVVSAENVELHADSGLPLKPGKYVLARISDSGTGIPGEHIEKIFDPYFSTKQNGSGLGLTTSYSIIKKHDGHLGVTSKLGEGATFFFYLPATRERTVVRAKNASGSPKKGHGRVLLMDDEEIVREVGGELLEHLGYSVEYANEGEEMLSKYAEAMQGGTPFDIVIMDLTIPGGLGGKRAVKKLREMDPDAVALVSSGYSNDPVMANYSKYGFAGVIRKPYSLEELAEIMRNALERKLGG